MVRRPGPIGAELKLRAASRQSPFEAPPPRPRRIRLLRVQASPAR
jgi:hypothetical protein